MRIGTNKAIGTAIASAAILLLAACHHTPTHQPSLPSRPPGEMFPRASSPPPNCPGQYRAEIENAGGNVFLGCWGYRNAGL
jgi:hypothetical protein